MKISSSAFKQGEKIPQKYTGEGEDVSPPLKIENPPPKTESFALIVEDPDAPMGTFDHWICWNLPSTNLDLEEGVGVAEQGTSHFGELGYHGPMPPQGHGPHRYFFKVYAVDTVLNLEEGISKKELLNGLKGHVLDHAECMGTYERE